MTTMTRDEAKLNECRTSLDKVIEARAAEDWPAACQWETIRRQAVIGALKEGFEISNISEASGMPVEEIRQIDTEIR